MNGKSTPQSMSVKSKEGSILTDKDQVKDRWREHFCELLNRTVPARRYHPSQQLWEELDIDTSEPSEEEVEKAINKLKNKSAGTDSVTAELIKYGGQPARGRFHSLLLKIWQEEQMKRRVRTLRGIEDGWKLSDLDFADDVALIEPDEEKSIAALARLRRAGEEVGLVVSAEKTKVMPIGETSACVKDGESTINKVKTFNYLGSTVTPINSIDTELNIRIGKAANTWRANISLKTKMRIYRAVIIPTLLYASETWATTRNHEQRLEAFDSRCLRIILKTKWWFPRRNSDIRELTDQPYASTLLMRNRLRWFGHMSRMGDERIP
ncbi:uncharacterized protein LOC130050564 [Ostrea edulis]|uniref:uncharacterized protein LOC130050564 n=1 Tax=Ostrea edulis TaxID=37623 RepID=UPI0024AF0370|nr:uncharacterized protein LOC130050564 [Ostrea edulis]